MNNKEIWTTSKVINYLKQGKIPSKGAMATTNFSWAELLNNQTEFPKEKELSSLVNNLYKSAKNLEVYRSYLGNTSITITSAYRSKKYNESIGGKPDSWHVKGGAIDFTVKGKTPQQVQKTLDLIHQGGLEYASTWTHVDLGAPRRFNEKNQDLTSKSKYNKILHEKTFKKYQDPHQIHNKKSSSSTSNSGLKSSNSAGYTDNLPKQAAAGSGVKYKIVEIPRAKPSFMSILGNILDIGGAIAGVLGGGGGTTLATKEVSAQIVRHSGGKVPGRGEVLALLKGGETVRTEGQEAAIQDELEKKNTVAPLGTSSNNSSQQNVPICANFTKQDEQ